MGNYLSKLCCCRRQEEDQSNELFRIVEEIPIEILDATRIYEEPFYETSERDSPEQNGIPEEPIYETMGPPSQNAIPEEPIYEAMGPPSQNAIPEETEDSSGYMEMRKLDGTPLYISLENERESFRFRVSVQHFYMSDMEDRPMVDAPVPIDLLLNGDKKNCLFHISVFNSHRERIEDLTLVGGVSPEFMMEYVIQWRDSREDSWRFKFSSGDTQNLFEQLRISPVKNVYVWASIVHNKNNTELKKFVLLSANPGVIPISPDIRQSAGCVMHMTAYNLQLTKTLDVVLVQENNPFSESECYNQFKNPRARSRVFSSTMPTFSN